MLGVVKILLYSQKRERRKIMRDLVLRHRLSAHAVHEFDRLVDQLLRGLPRPAGGVLVGRRRLEPRDRAWAAAQAVSDGRWAHAILRVPHGSEAHLISQHPWQLRRQLGWLWGHLAYPVGMRWCPGRSGMCEGWANA